MDTSKNPKWIDVELAGPIAEGKVSKFYGSYEVVDGRLKMALGTKRLTRPLEFTEVTDVLLLDVKATMDPVPATRKIIHEPPTIKVEPLPGPPATAITPKAAQGG